MTTFKEIRGKLIRTLDTDPTPAANYIGEIWYNKTIGVLKAAGQVPSSYASGGTKNNTDFRGGSFGTQSAAIAAGGYPPAGANAANSSSSESYNGSAWTTTPSINTARTDVAGAGTQTAGLLAGGGSSPNGSPYTDPEPVFNATEEWNGSTWTTVPGTLNTTRGGLGIGATGTQTASLVFGGNVAPTPSIGPGNTSASEEYDGTTWTSGNPINTNVSNMGRGGTQTAGIKIGGMTPVSDYVDTVEHYDGTSWAAATAVPTTMRFANSAGPQTNLVIMGFDTGPGPGSIETISYNGSSWSAETNLPRVMGRSFVGGNGSDGLVAGGFPQTSQTFEYVGASIGTRTLTTS